MAFTTIYDKSVAKKKAVLLEFAPSPREHFCFDEFASKVCKITLAKVRKLRRMRSPDGDTAIANTSSGLEMVKNFLKKKLATFQKRRNIRASVEQDLSHKVSS